MKSADFETNNDLNDCHVWLWGVCDINEPNDFQYGLDIQSFICYMRDNPDTYFFHNAKFDCEFIFAELFNMGFIHNSGNKLIANSFQTLISENGLFYECKICFETPTKHKKGNVSTIRDSLKKLPMSVDRIAKAFHMPISKLEIDYNKPHPIGYQPTKDEIAYQKNDVQIIALALKTQFGQGLERMTIGSDALHNYKDTIDFKNVFPILDDETDAFIRQSYKGGWTYANPKFQADREHPKRTVGAGLVLDVNSLYPSVMYDRLLPYGVPLDFVGEYEQDNMYPLYIVNITCHFELKPNHFPTIQIKHSPFYMASEYIENSEGYADLTLTNVDLALMQEHYYVDIQSYNGGLKFKGRKGLFCNYIDYWMAEKNKHKGGRRELAKLMLNSLYGKFATNTNVRQKYPVQREDGSIAYKLLEPEFRKPVYTAMASFITSYAREVTITGAQQNFDRFLYGDTDSLHLLGTEIPENIDVHPDRLGAWKEETLFDKGKYLRAKAYMEHVTHTGEKDENGNMQMVPCEPYNNVKCAGFPKDLRQNITFEQFEYGAVFEGKLRPIHVKNGVVLADVPFTII